MPRPEKYCVASHTDSPTPASSSDVSTCWPQPGPVPVLERREDADCREEAGAEIGQRDAATSPALRPARR